MALFKRGDVYWYEFVYGGRRYRKSANVGNQRAAREIEAAFKTMKSELGIRPIYHQLQHRVEAHILIAFLAYCLHVTLKGKLRSLAPGLTPRAVLDKLACIQMLDVYFPTTDGRKLRFRRYTKPQRDQALLLAQMKLQLPPQPPPEITANQKLIMG